VTSLLPFAARAAVPLVCSIVLLNMLGAPRVLRSVPNDSLHYAAFAQAISTGQLFTLHGAEVPAALSVRTPGYPLVMLGGSLVTGDLRDGYRLAHAVGAVATTLGVPLLLAPVCATWISAPAVAGALWISRTGYHRPLTEWTATLLLLWLFAFCARYAQAPSKRRLLWLGLAASLAVLTRPALLPVLALPLIFAVIPWGSTPRRASWVAVLSLFPVLLWMSFNLYRLDSFTLTPFAGVNLFGAARIVGTAAPDPADDPAMAAFVEHINQHPKFPEQSRRRNWRDTEELLPGIEGGVPKALWWAYNWNIHEVALPYLKEQNADPVETNRLMLGYANRVLLGDPWGYVNFVLRGLGRLLELLPVLPSLLLLPVWWLARGRHRGLALAALAMLLVDVMHVGLCALVELVINRYRWLTLYPLMGVAAITSAVFIQELVQSGWKTYRARPSSA